MCIRDSIEEAGPGRKFEPSHDLGRIVIGVAVIDRLGVEVEVVITEGGRHVESHGPSSPVASAGAPSPGAFTGAAPGASGLGPSQRADCTTTCTRQSKRNCGQA